MRRCLPADISRSALHRCLRRNGVSQKHREPKPEAQSFAPEPFGYVHIDLKYLPRLQGRPAYVFVAIERATRFVYVEIVQQRSGATIAACLKRFLEAFGHPVHTILTDNGAEFTDRFGDARWRKRDRGTGDHPFDQVCQHHGVRHKLTRPHHPQTNGMVERFNRRLAEALESHPRSGGNPAKTASPITPSATHSSKPSSMTTIAPDCDASATTLPPSSSLTSRHTTRKQGPGRMGKRTQKLRYLRRQGPMFRSARCRSSISSPLNLMGLAT